MTQAELVAVAELYAHHRGITLSTLGRWTVNEGKFFARLRDGGSCTMRTGEAAALWLSANWPQDLEWPDEIARPQAQRVAA